MASKPKTTGSAAEAAARAVEEALDVELTFESLEADIGAGLDNEFAAKADTTGSQKPGPSLENMSDDEVFNELERKLSAAANDLREAGNEGARKPKTSPAAKSTVPEPAQPQKPADNLSTASDLLPANDDRRDTVSELVYGLQRKASRLPLYLALILSAAWIALVTYYVNYTDPAMFDTNVSLSAKLADTRTYLYLGIATIPVLLLWAFAALLRRAQEMRNAAHSMTEAAIRLMQPETIATDSINTVGRAIRREVAAMGDGVERALARAGELEAMVQGEVLNLQRSYSDSEIRLRTLLVDLGKERENVVEHAERLRSSISGSHEGLSEELSNAGSRIQTLIDQATNALTDRLSSREQTISATLNEAGENLVSVLSTSGTDIENRINMAGTTVANLIETQSARLTSDNEAMARQFEDAIALRVSEFSSRMEDAGSNLQSLLDTRFDNLHDTISTRGDAFVQALGTRTDALDKVLTDRTAVISDTLKERLGTFGSTMNDHLDAVTRELSTRQESLEKTTSNIGESVLARSTEFEQSIFKQHADIAASLQNGLAAISQKADEIRTGIAAQNEAMESGLDEKSRGMIAVLDEKLASLTAGVEANAASLADLMEEKQADIMMAIRSGSENLFSGLDTQTGNLREAMDKRTTTLIGGLANQSSSFASNLEERVNNIGASIDEKSISLLTGIDERTGKLEHSIDSRSAGFAEGMETRVTAIASNIDEKSAKLLSGIEARAEALGAIIVEGEDAITNAVENKYGLFSKILVEKQNVISVNLDETIEATVGTIDEKAAAIADILTERAAIINTTLGQGLIDSQRLLETKSKEFNDLLDSRSSELSTILDETALPLVDQIRQQGDEVALKLTAVHKSVDTDVSELLTKLGGVSEAMVQLINQATSNLDTMQHTITNQAESMNSAVEKAREDVMASTEIAESAHMQMDQTTQNLLTNIGQIAERFDQQGNMLHQATVMIDNAQRNFADTLADREGALDQLAGGLSQRTAEIEKSMIAFGDMLTRTMEEMSQRSRSVGASISGEVGAAIEETTARFAAATEAMRQASQDVQRELEDTRNQMRRGVMELPDETRQSADAMRKVVADQIAALRDLSEIVSKSGKALDTAPASLAPRQQYAAASGVSRPARASQSTIDDLQRRPQRPPRPATQSASPRIPQTPQRPASSGNQGAGWVSDLLKRASVDDAPYTPGNRQNELHKVESLNSLSMDIARLMDDAASVDLWERYQRGERNVFTRRLYTSQGQQTFDEIRRKYGLEPEFRNAVDRYMDDFERLLTDVARNDRDNMMTQTYLTSDTGKVYTMLAHAAGRLGS